MPDCPHWPKTLPLLKITEEIRRADRTKKGGKINEINKAGEKKGEASLPSPYLFQLS